MSPVRDAAALRELGARIADARRDRGLSQRDLSIALGIPVFCVERFEAGAADAREQLSSIAAFMGCEIEWFMPMPTKAYSESRPVAPADKPNLGRPERLLVLGAIVLLTTIRFFTEVVPVLPRAANFIDIPILFTLVFAAFLSPPPHRGPRRWYLHLALPSLAFLILCTLSVIVNSGRVAVAPVLVFVYGFLAPLAVYSAGYRLWPPGSSLLFSRTIVALGIVQLAVVVAIDVPQFIASRNPDDIAGTFGTNQYQFVFFLLLFVSLVVGIATFEPDRVAARVAPIIIIASFATMLLAQYRAFLVVTLVVLLAIGILLGGRARGFAVVGFSVVVFGIVFYYLAAQLPVLKLNSAASSIAANPGAYVRGRLGVGRTVFRLYADIPSAISLGTGPGTYSSRAWQTFASAESDSASNVQGSYASALTGGHAYGTDVSDKYILPQLKNARVVEGSYAIALPYSSYTSLLAEVGVGGFAVITMLYFAATVRAWKLARHNIARSARDNALASLSLATAIAFLTLIQAAILENWFEVTRITFIVWLMLAVVSKESNEYAKVDAGAVTDELQFAL